MPILLRSSHSGGPRRLSAGQTELVKINWNYEHKITKSWGGSEAQWCSLFKILLLRVWCFVLSWGGPFLGGHDMKLWGGSNNYVVLLIKILIKNTIVVRS